MDIRNFLKDIPKEEINKRNEEELARSIKEHKEFTKAFEKDCCYLCGMKLDYFNSSEDCFHWFLLPPGIKKKDFKQYLNNPIGYFQLESYLRWVANTNGLFKNINDLQEESYQGKLIERTIKYKNIEWTFNIGKTDIEGHDNSANANFPHFHIQIFQDGKPFVKFNDFHIPFSHHDLFLFEAIKNEDLVEHLNLFGEGMSVIENETDLKWIDEHLESCESIEDATFHTSSMFVLPDGQSITIDQLDQYRLEAKKLKQPLRKYLEKQIPDIKIVTEIKPGKGVVDKKHRTKRK